MCNVSFHTTTRYSSQQTVSGCLKRCRRNRFHASPGFGTWTGTWQGFLRGACAACSASTAHSRPSSRPLRRPADPQLHRPGCVRPAAGHTTDALPARMCGLGLVAARPNAAALSIHVHWLAHHLVHSVYSHIPIVHPLFHAGI